MRMRDRARVAAPALLAAVAGTASVGIAALVRTGFCVHRLLGLTPPAGSMRGMAMPMDGMALPMTGTAMPVHGASAAAAAAGGTCSILAAALVVALLVYAAALAVLARRVVAALSAVLVRLLAPGDGARWTRRAVPLAVPAGVRLARRGRSRAPPSLR